jgi:hypothetical protein
MIGRLFSSLWWMPWDVLAGAKVPQRAQHAPRLAVQKRCRVDQGKIVEIYIAIPTAVIIRHPATKATLRLLPITEDIVN